MTLELETTSIQSLHASRRQHFTRLGYAPELYVELMTATCRAYRLSRSGELAGHLLVASDGTLIEFALTPTACRDKERVFDEVCRQLGLRSVFCFSFDSTLVSLCVGCRGIAHPHGVLYRDFDQGTMGALPVLRPAVETDIPTILPIRHNVFDDDEQVPQWIRSGWVFVLEEGDDFVGVGLCSPVWSDIPERDIGVLVHPDKRGMGHGRSILASLAQACLRAGLVPTAGCAHDNTASRAALKRAGFVSRHSLIRFELPE